MTKTRREAMFLATSAAVCAGAAAAGPAEDDLASRLRVIAARSVADGQTAGFALGVRRFGSPPAVFGLGVADIEAATPVTPDTVFRIASCTKQFTAAAVVLLSERGALALDAPLDRFFPGFPASPGGRVPTIEQLLTHTAGFHDYVLGGLPADAGSDWRHDPERWRLMSRLTPLYDFEPGALWGYSNSNYVLLGAIVEHVSGQSYGDFVTRNILLSHGLLSTAFDSYADAVPRRAVGYSLDGGAPKAFRKVADGGLPVAEGGLRSTVGDMLAWNQALFGGKVVSPAGVKRMTQAARTTDGAPVGSAHFTPKGMNPGKPPAFVQQADYGYGLEVARIFDTPVIWHSGGLPGFNSIVLHFPEKQVDVVLLTNTDNGAVGAFEPTLRAATGTA